MLQCLFSLIGFLHLVIILPALHTCIPFLLLLFRSRSPLLNLVGPCTLFRTVSILQDENTLRINLRTHLSCSVSGSGLFFRQNKHHVLKEKMELKTAFCSFFPSLCSRPTVINIKSTDRNCVVYYICKQYFDHNAQAHKPCSWPRFHLCKLCHYFCVVSWRVLHAVCFILSSP